MLTLSILTLSVLTHSVAGPVKQPNTLSKHFKPKRKNVKEVIDYHSHSYTTMLQTVCLSEDRVRLH